MSTHLFLERSFDPPLAVADVHERVRSSEWCYDLHKVNWHASLLAAGGRTMLCWFEAPDAESARLALRQSGADTRSLWAGTVHEPAQPGNGNVVVERIFDSPVEFEQIAALARAGSWCMQTHRAQHVRSFFSANRQRMLCLYGAPDAESVRMAQREAGLPFSAVWAFERIAPDTMPKT